jgi:hypothetical protein
VHFGNLWKIKYWGPLAVTKCCFNATLLHHLVVASLHARHGCCLACCDAALLCCCFACLLPLQALCCLLLCLCCCPLTVISFTSTPCLGCCLLLITSLHFTLWAYQQGSQRLPPPWAQPPFSSSPTRQGRAKPLLQGHCSELLQAAQPWPHTACSATRRRPLRPCGLLRPAHQHR